VPRVSSDILLNLNDKLARWRYDQGPDTMSGGRGQEMKDRKGEGGRLPRACLGDANQVAATDDERYGGLLDRRRLRVTRLLDGTEDGLVKA
jgi:hypothetical protein